MSEPGADRPLRPPRPTNQTRSSCARHRRRRHRGPRAGGAVTATAADGTRRSARGSSCRRTPRPRAPVPLVVFAHGGPLGFVERLELALEPAPLRRARLRRPDAGPGHLARLRPADGPARLGPLGRGAPYTDIMAAADAALKRPDLDSLAHRAHGRQLRRLHGQLGRRPDGPLPRHRHPRLAVGPAAVPRHHGLRAWTGSTRWATRTRQPERVRPPVAGHPHRRRSRRRCWSSTASTTSACPVSEALTLWTDLHRHGVKARFLYFPDENHWVLKPQQLAGLVRDGAGLPGPARPRQGLGAAGAAVARSGAGAASLAEATSCRIRARAVLCGSGSVADHVTGSEPEC